MPSPGSRTVLFKICSGNLPLGSPGKLQTISDLNQVSGGCACVCVCVHFSYKREYGGWMVLMMKSCCLASRPQGSLLCVWGGVGMKAGARVTGTKVGNVIQLCIELCAKHHI